MKNINCNLQELKKEETMNINGGGLTPEQLRLLFEYINDILNHIPQ